jgi:hypothetical protein
MNRRLLVMFLAAVGAAFAGEPDFDRVVKAIETHYGIHRLHIPFLSLGTFVVNVARPEGASGLKLAIFEDLKFSPEYSDWKERDRFIDSLVIGEMQPLVRVHSRRDGNSTYIFAEPSGKSAKMLIATFDRNDATLVQVKVDMSRLMKSIEKPEQAGKTFSSRRDTEQ